MKVQFLLSCFVMLTFSNCIAQTISFDNFYDKGGKLYSLGLEHVSGFNTSVEAYSLRLGYGTMVSKNLVLYGFLDLSATDGVRLLNTAMEATTLNAESFGLGTSFLLRWYFIQIGRVGLFLDASGGILYTFKSFPPQGTKLNFTARPGSGIAFSLNRQTQFNIGLNRFHLSNGQGYKQPNNPAYDGLGIFMNVVFSVK